MIKVGRLCVKLAGRDAGKKCVVVDILDKNFVLIDGETRRRKCNVLHLEPLKDVIKVSKGVDHSAVVAEFKKLGIELKERKAKEKKEKPKKVRKKKEKPVEEEKKKPAPKKETKKEEKVEKKEEVKQ